MLLKDKKVLITGAGRGIGTNGRDVNETRNAGGGDSFGYRAGAKGLHRGVSLAANGRENADEVDDGVGTADRPIDRGTVAQVGLHRHDLAEAAERLQMRRQIGASTSRADAPAALGQRTHYVATEETGSPEDGDDRLFFPNDGHDDPFLRVFATNDPGRRHVRRAAFQ